MRTRKTIFMFSGQGSQYRQMGRALFATNRTFRDWMLELDSQVQRLCGQSVVRELYDSADTAVVFDRTLLTHPAIFMVEYSLAMALIEAGINPECTWGASVGAFAAAVVAGFMDVGEGLRLVVAQARALEDHCECGSMLAILSSPALYRQPFLRDRADLAAINLDSHFVVALPASELGAATAQLQRQNVVHQPLPVAFAFHSRWIEAARQPFESHTRAIEERRPHMAMMCCQSVSLLERLPAGYFWQVAREPIRFAEAAKYMESSGSCCYIDVGPSATLGTFLTHGLPRDSQSTIYKILTPFGRDVEGFNAVVHATAANRGSGLRSSR